jgi:spore maturation protein SpmA/spore maturation protein SpmB
MLNFVWLGLIVLAVLLGGMTGNIQLVGDQAIEGANTAVTLAAKLFAIMTLWLGLMRLADKAGLVHRLGLALKPIMIWLFPEVPPDHPAMGAIIMNMAANILGLNNAATPLGLRAMSELDSLNRRPGVATNAMCMLLAINTSSITLIPVSIIGILALSHGKNPTIIIGTSLAATAFAHVAAIATAKILERSRFYRLPPLPESDTDVILPEKIGTRPADAREGETVAKNAEASDTGLPWVPGARWILAGLAGAFLGMLLGLAFPELTNFFSNLFHFYSNEITVAAAADPESNLHFFFIRPLSAISMLAIPWLILFFPVYSALRRIPVYEEFVEGGREAFQVVLRILPYIVGMLVAVFMFRAAGGEKLLTYLLQPITTLLHFPAELVPLALLRPFSGTASLALFQDLVTHFGPDAPLTLTAATMYGCSETTFYVIAIYFGSVGIRKTRHAIPAGLVADLVGPIASVIICRAVFGPF